MKVKDLLLYLQDEDLNSPVVGVLVARGVNGDEVYLKLTDLTPSSIMGSCGETQGLQLNYTLSSLDEQST